MDYTCELDLYTIWIRPVNQSTSDTPLEEPTAAIAGEDPCFVQGYVGSVRWVGQKYVKELCFLVVVQGFVFSFKCFSL